MMNPLRSKPLKQATSSSVVQPINEQNDLRNSVENYERSLIEKAIAEEKGNKNKAARKLQLTRQALHYKLRKYGISDSEKE